MNSVENKMLLHKRRALHVVVWSVLLLAGALATSAQNIAANVDRNEISIDEQVLLRIRIEGSQDLRPQLPEMPDFQVVPRGQETAMSVVNGRMSTSVTYNFVLVPRRIGEFQLGPFTVEIEGESYSTRPFTIKVREPSTEKAAESQDYFLRARVSHTEPFVGQQIVYTWRFYRRVNITDARLQPFDFGSLLVEEIGGGEVRDFQTTVNGVEYLVSELRRGLFAQRPGPTVVPPSELAISVPRARRRRGNLFDEFMGRGRGEAVTLRSNAVEIDVQPLPSPPAGFSGLVGDFDVETSVSRTALRVGESVTLETVVSGKGNAQQITHPDLGELADWKSYEDPVKIEYDRTGGAFKGKKTFRRALVPVRPGQLQVPAANVIFFDPENEQFRTATAPAIDLEVQPGDGEEDLRLTESVAPGTGKVAVRVLADDIQPIERELEALAPDTIRGGRAFLWGAVWLLPAVGFACLFLVRRRNQRYLDDRGLRRRETADRRAREGLQTLAQVMSKERAQKASRVVRDLVGDKLGFEGSVLTPLETQQVLLDTGVAEPTARRSREVLERLDAAQFGGVSSAAAALDAVPALVESLIRELDAAGKRSRGSSGSFKPPRGEVR